MHIPPFMLMYTVFASRSRKNTFQLQIGFYQFHQYVNASKILPIQRHNHQLQPFEAHSKFNYNEQMHLTLK